VNGLREEQLESAHLRVRFRFFQDRFAHDVWLSDGTTWVCVLQSVEGSPSDDWPASPPLQSLHFERRDERQLALAVGMAGHSHWSASIELDPREQCAKFDIACRSRGAMAPWLGSSYRVLDVQPGKKRAVPQAVLNPRALPGVRMAIERCGEAVQTELELAPGGVRIAAQSEPSKEEAQTVRWAYKLTWLRSEPAS
jgi:hypothetical protein